MPRLDQAISSLINKYPVLSRSEMDILLKKFDDSRENPKVNRIIQNKILCHNMKLVISVMNKMHIPNHLYTDCFQEGNIGLLKAISDFNLNKNVAFSTYATWWIRAKIRQFLLANSNEIRIPLSAPERALFSNYAKIRSSLEASGKQATDKEIAKQLLAIRGISVSEETVKKYREMSEMKYDSIDGENKEVLMNELIAEESNYDKHVIDKIISDYRESLSERDKLIFDSRIIHQKSFLTLEEVGNQVGVSKQRIQQIEASIIETLKKRLKRFN